MNQQFQEALVAAGQKAAAYKERVRDLMTRVILPTDLPEDSSQIPGFNPTTPRRYSLDLMARLNVPLPRILSSGDTKQRTHF